MDKEGTSPLNVANSSYNTSVTSETASDQLEAQVEVPINAEVPASINAEVPASINAEVPASINAEVPASIIVEVPASIKTEVPSHIKPKLEKEIKSDSGRATRSKATENFEFKELDFPKKRIKKMAPVLKLEDSFRLIPICTGVDDIYQFINACDMAVDLVDAESAPTLIKYITTRLTGRALEMIKYKNVSKWSYIKSYLTDAFEVTTTASTLQLQLNSIKMQNHEDVNDYCHRIEKLYYQLCTMSTINKTDPKEAKIIHEQLREQTLANFIKGLIPPLRTIVKALSPKTLEIAKQIAKSEEVEYLAERRNNYINDKRNNPPRNNWRFNNYNNNNNQRMNNAQSNNRNYGNYRPNNPVRINNYPRTNNFSQPNNANRPVIKCYNCNGNHYASQCRNNTRPNYAGNGNNNRSPNTNNFTQPPTNYNIQVVTCTYCNRNGHNISTCYKKRNDESRNSNNSGNANVSNEGRGTRSINQIIAEEPTQESFTSSQL